MSNIGEARGFRREALKARRAAKREKDPAKRARLLLLAVEYEEEAKWAWSAARQEAREEEDAYG